MSVPIYDGSACKGGISEKGSVGIERGIPIKVESGGEDFSDDKITWEDGDGSIHDQTIGSYQHGINTQLFIAHKNEATPSTIKLTIHYDKLTIVPAFIYRFNKLWVLNRKINSQFFTLT